MSSELIKRIFTSVILLIITLYILIYFKEDYFLYFTIAVGIICYAEWLLTNDALLKKFSKGFIPDVIVFLTNKSFYKYFSIYLFGFIYFLILLPLSAFYLRVEVSLSFLLFIGTTFAMATLRIWRSSTYSSLITPIHLDWRVQSGSLPSESTSPVCSHTHSVQDTKSPIFSDLSCLLPKTTSSFFKTMLF